MFRSLPVTDRKYSQLKSVRRPTPKITLSESSKKSINPVSWRLANVSGCLQIVMYNPEDDSQLVWSVTNQTLDWGEFWASLQRQIRHPPPHITEILTVWYAMTRPYQLPSAKLIYELRFPFEFQHIIQLYHLYEQAGWDPAASHLPSLDDWQAIIKRALTKDASVTDNPQIYKFFQLLAELERPKVLTVASPKHTQVEVEFIPSLKFKPC